MRLKVREMHAMESTEVIPSDSNLSILELEGKRENIYGMNLHKATVV